MRKTDVTWNRSRRHSKRHSEMARRYSEPRPYAEDAKASLTELMVLSNTPPRRHTMSSMSSAAMLGYAAVATEDEDESQGQEASERLPPADFAELPIDSEEEGKLCEFVNSGWFQILSACVIIVNTVIMVMEFDDPSLHETLSIADQSMLSFYVIELLCRACFFRHFFFCGPLHIVAWNVMDSIVVVAGMMDEWILTLVHVKGNGSLQTVLTSLRFLRIFRVLKIIRIFLTSDLSWTEHPYFQSFIGLVIFINSLLMGFETDIDWNGWFYIEQVLLSIYLFELAVRLKKFKCYFLSFTNPDFFWNTFDFVIVVSSTLDTWIVPGISLVLKKMAISSHHHDKERKGGMNLAQLMMLMRMLRLMRILRLVKLIKAVRPLYILITGVLAALQGIAWVLVLTVTVLYAMGILATRLIGHGLVFPDGDVPEQDLFVFQSVPDSMFTLFRCMSGASSDSEVAAIDNMMSRVPAVKFGFIFFMVCGSWTLLSILTAVVSENMLFTTGQEEEERKLAQAEEDRAVHIKQLELLFADIAKNQHDDIADSHCSFNNVVALDDLDRFLQDPNNALATARRCRVPVRDVKDVLETLNSYDRPVTLDEFVESLVDVAHPTTEKSVLKILSHFAKLQQACDDIDDKLEKSLGVMLESVDAKLENLCRQQQAEIAAKIDRVLEHLKISRDFEDSTSSLLRRTLPNLEQRVCDANEAISDMKRKVCASIASDHSLAENGQSAAVPAATDRLEADSLILDGLAANDQVGCIWGSRSSSSGDKGAVDIPGRSLQTNNNVTDAVQVAWKRASGYIAGEQLHQETMTIEQAKNKCRELPGCTGFYYQGDFDVSPSEAVAITFVNTVVLQEGWNTFTSYLLEAGPTVQWPLPKWARHDDQRPRFQGADLSDE